MKIIQIILFFCFLFGTKVSGVDFQRSARKEMNQGSGFDHLESSASSPQFEDWSAGSMLPSDETLNLRVGEQGGPGPGGGPGRPGNGGEVPNVPIGDGYAFLLGVPLLYGLYIAWRKRKRSSASPVCK